MRADNYFTQIPDWITNAPISHGAYRLYGILGTYASRSENSCYPSYQTLADRLGCSKRQVMKYTKELVSIKALVVHKRAKENSPREHDTNEYILITTPPHTHDEPPTPNSGSEPKIETTATQAQPQQPPAPTRPSTTPLTNTLATTDIALQAQAHPTHTPPSNRGHRVPEDFMPAQKHIDKIRQLKPGLNLEIEHTKFMNHWLSSTGRNATKKDWGRAWENWMLNAREPHTYKPGWQKRLEYNAQLNQQYQDPGEEFLRSIEQ